MFAFLIPLAEAEIFCISLCGGCSICGMRSASSPPNMAFPTFLEKQVHPSQLFGLETNIYAQELASVVVWIGYLQWLNEHGIGWPTEPILAQAR